MKRQIYLDTEQQVLKFVNTAVKYGKRAIVSDDEGMVVNAKSMLGMLYAMTFNKLYLETETSTVLFDDFCVE